MEEWVVTLGEPDEEGNQKVIEKTKLVRCMDCAYGTETCGNIRCESPDTDSSELIIHTSMWYCADGIEKKEATK